MKIYQLHEYSGEYEDYRDRIVGSYLRKERAEEEKAKAEAKDKELKEQQIKCLNCPFIEEPFKNIKILAGEYPDYCSKANLIDSTYDTYCTNYYVYWDEAIFEIKEVEVEE